jgi:hypothetical protein
MPFNLNPLIWHSLQDSADFLQHLDPLHRQGGLARGEEDAIHDVDSELILDLADGDIFISNFLLEVSNQLVIGALSLGQGCLLLAILFGKLRLQLGAARLFFRQACRQCRFLSRSSGNWCCCLKRVCSLVVVVSASWTNLCSSRSARSVQSLPKRRSAASASPAREGNSGFSWWPARSSGPLRSGTEEASGPSCTGTGAPSRLLANGVGSVTAAKNPRRRRWALTANESQWALAYRG